MKKKLIIALVIIMALVVSMMGFIACDDTDTTPQQEQNQGDVQEGQGDGNPSDEVVVYTVTSEQWDAALSLYWKNLTYEFTDGEGSQKLELLADGSFHQYAGMWGEVYSIYRADQEKWQVYQGSATTPSFNYTTQQDYIDGNYGDDFGFMKSMLPSISGMFNEFTFNTETNSYFGDDVLVPNWDSTPIPMDVTAKFENQNIVYVNFVFDAVHHFECNFWNYGKTTIDFPDYVKNA